MHRAIVGVLIAGCAGDDSGEETGTAPAYPPTWAGVEQLLAENCDQCHPSQQNLDLHTAIPDDIAGIQRLVVPGSAEDSLLWQFVSGISAFKMPPTTGGGLLPIETVDPIRLWIDAGASLE